MLTLLRPPPVPSRGRPGDVRQTDLIRDTCSCSDWRGGGGSIHPFHLIILVLPPSTTPTHSPKLVKIFFSLAALSLRQGSMFCVLPVMSPPSQTVLCRGIVEKKRQLNRRRVVCVCVLTPAQLHTRSLLAAAH